MIGLDTNVIVRYLVQDEPKQSGQANRIIEKAVTDGKILHISQITLCEIVWVLERCYRVSRKELINVLKQLLQTQKIRVEQDAVSRQALIDFEHHEGVDFTDCLIGRQNASNDCSFTYTFDKKAAKKLHSTFKLISYIDRKVI
jgi:predicted nucleic-acid-binding protein